MCAIPSKIAVAYKFFDLFKVVLKDSETDKRGLHWSSCAIDTKLSDEVLIAFRAYLKAKKAELKKCDASSQCEKMLWFFYHKIFEVGAFDVEGRRDILQFINLCEYIML